jgi:hypothetical protein
VAAQGGNPRPRRPVGVGRFRRTDALGAGRRIQVGRVDRSATASLAVTVRDGDLAVNSQLSVS